MLTTIFHDVPVLPNVPGAIHAGSVHQALHCLPEFLAEISGKDLLKMRSRPALATPPIMFTGLMLEAS